MAAGSAAPLPVLHGGAAAATKALSHSGHRLCWHPDAGCVCQQVNLLLAPSRGQKAKNPSRLHTHKQLFEEAQFLEENKASICLTLSEGEKRLDLLFSLGLHAGKDVQVAVPGAGGVSN